MTELDQDIRLALDGISPTFEGWAPDWSDALRRSRDQRRPRRPLVVAFAALVALVGLLGATPLGHALVGGAFDRLSGWVGNSPGEPASPAEQEALRAANSRAAAPIPGDTELGLLTRATIKGESFDLFGFRDHNSLCLRLRTTAVDRIGIVKAPADCVSQQLLVDMGKPLAVVSAANPFPRSAGSGLQALYGLAADGVAAVDLRSESGIHRVPVENNAFLYLYEGASPRLKDNRLVYASDVPARAAALDAAGRALGSVEIMSLKRGYPGAPPATRLPGPSVVQRELAQPRVGWLERGEDRGEPYELRDSDANSSQQIELRLFHPNPETSMRVLVGRPRSLEPSEPNDPTYWIANLWPLGTRPTVFVSPTFGARGPLILQSAQTEFDAQFPVFYGLVADGVTSLELYLANGTHEPVPIVDNIFAFQAPSASPAKLVGSDAEGRVVLVRVLEL